MTNPIKSAVATVMAIICLSAFAPARASMEFNGSSSYTVINASFLNGVTTSTFTFDFWIKPADVNRFQMVWGKVEDWKEWAFSFGSPNGSIGFFQAWPVVYYDVSSPPGVLKADQWQHIVLVGDGTVAQFYIDGVAVTTTGPLHGQLSFNAQPNGSARGGMVWGLRDNTTLPDDGWFKGLMSHFRVWDRALSAAEVAAFQRIPPADTAQGLRHHIPLNETANALFHDVVGGLEGTGFDINWSNDNPVLLPTVPRGATATTQVINGFVIGVAITDPGYGYTNTPAVRIVGGGGSGAEAFATMVNGVVTAITVRNAGSGYSGIPTVEIDLPPFPPKRAVATATVANGFLVGAALADPGYGYAEPPVVLVVGGGGSGAVIVAEVAHQVVTGFKILNAGSGYTSAPRILIAAPPFAPSLDIAVSKVTVTLKVNLGKKYQLESTADLKTWSPVGDPFVAQEELLVQEFSVKDTGQVFRIRQTP